MISDEDIINVCSTAPSMSKACSILRMNLKTFTKRARNLGVYKKNQGSKGVKRDIEYKSIDINEILEGKHPQYQSNKLRLRLIKDSIKEAECECCGLSEWNGLPIPLELNHIDGDRHNHLIKNLEIICPNCHAQTPTYRARNIGRKK
jgi:hypothetical protein